MKQSKDQLKDVRILVVEDEKDSREIVQFVLEQSGAAVVAVESFKEAIEAYQQIEPNIVVADIAMPDYNGYALIARIREEDRDRGKLTPAIALTAFSGDADQKTALSAGFQEYMSKPFDPAELIATIARLVGPGGSWSSAA
ncbi:MAG TPA: response regulator [Terriglobia bacterium]|nr:response regulator [Terriglobia bacterium]